MHQLLDVGGQQLQPSSFTGDAENDFTLLQH
jgi:hypothetical protein